ncbi:hypothetical protein, partial [Bacillus subtilis]|uniref:hypothetical protein n=1 Tax=Bacillus subtilis TaxID=1423 RepID=UPI001BDBA7B0
LPHSTTSLPSPTPYSLKKKTPTAQTINPNITPLYQSINSTPTLTLNKPSIITSTPTIIIITTTTNIIFLPLKS